MTRKSLRLKKLMCACFTDVYARGLGCHMSNGKRCSNDFTTCLIVFTSLLHLFHSLPQVAYMLLFICVFGLIPQGFVLQFFPVTHIAYGS